MATKKKQLALVPPDGVPIPAELLGELRAAFAAQQQATQEANAHNERGKLIERKLIAAQSILDHYGSRAEKACGLSEGGSIDLERGVMIPHSTQPASAS